MAVNKDRRGVVIRPGLALAADPNWPEGESVALRVNKITGALKTEVTGAGSGGTSATDGDAFTAGASAGTPLMGENGTTLKIALVNAVRALVIQLANSAGTEIGTLGNPIRTQEVGGGGAVSIADGSDVAEGTTTDAKVVGDNAGTVSAKLRGLNTTLTSVDGKVPALGQALAAASTPVVLTAAQITTLTPPAAITGFATSAKQDTGNTSVASIDAKVPALGQALAAASVPVILPSATITTLTPPAAITGFATAVKQPALGTAGTASADVITIQGVASMTKLLVTPDSVALPANQSCNVAQINGVTPLMGAGNTGTGSPRVTIATDQASIPVSGAGAAAAAVAGNPVRNGILGRTTLPTSVSSAQLVDTLGDRYGRQYRVAPITSNASSAGTAITTNTNTSMVAAPSAGNHLRIHRLWAQNSSATATWCYWGNGSGVKTIPFYLATGQPMMMNLQGSWELSTATALFMNTATTGANIEWWVEYETLTD